MEEQFMQVFPKLPDAIERDIGDWDTLARIFIILPIDIGKELKSLLKQADDKQINESEICLQIAASMRKSLDEIDKKINELMT